MFWENEKGSSVVNDRGIERLVDGELTPSEFRAVVAALDDEPGGWRRCGLAFLEAQALRRELADVAAAVEPSQQHRCPRPAKAREQLPTLLAAAASCLIAFGLGIAAPRLFSPRQQESELAGNLLKPSPLADENATPHQVLRPVGNLRLVMDGPAGESTDAGQVPVYETGGDIEQYLGAESPALAPETIEWLRQQGYDVRHEQQFFPAPTDDGRQIIVPVDGYQITPVSRRY
jgi:hypothetical protein